MKWNIFILVFVWNQTIGLPFEICCADDQREDDSFVLDAPEQAELYDNVPEEEEEEDKKSLFNSFQQVVIPAVDLVGGCDERCCRRQGFHNSWDKKDSESQLVRTKRFPWHLDPLYQYRYLARSGRELIIILFHFFHFFKSPLPADLFHWVSYVCSFIMGNFDRFNCDKC